MSPSSKPSKFERFISFTDNVRKLAVNIFLTAAFFIEVISLIVHYNKKQLLIYPIELPASLKAQGYTGQIVTTLILDHIRRIKLIGAAYYSSQDIEVPSWENGIDEFKDAVSNQTFAQLSAVMRFLFAKKAGTGTGEIINVRKDSLKINFRMGDDLLSVTDDVNRLDTIIDTTAEFILEKKTLTSSPVITWSTNSGRSASGFARNCSIVPIRSGIKMIMPSLYCSGVRLI